MTTVSPAARGTEPRANQPEAPTARPDGGFEALLAEMGNTMTAPRAPAERPDRPATTTPHGSAAPQRTAASPRAATTAHDGGPGGRDGGAPRSSDATASAATASAATASAAAASGAAGPSVPAVASAPTAPAVGGPAPLAPATATATLAISPDLATTVDRGTFNAAPGPTGTGTTATLAPSDLATTVDRGTFTAALTPHAPPGRTYAATSSPSPACPDSQHAIRSTPIARRPRNTRDPRAVCWMTSHVGHGESHESCDQNSPYRERGCLHRNRSRDWRHSRSTVTWISFLATNDPSSVTVNT